MTDAIAPPRCDCRIFAATGLPCRDCPKARRREDTGMAQDIPTFLRRQLPGDAPPPRRGRCCED